MKKKRRRNAARYILTTREEITPLSSGACSCAVIYLRTANSSKPPAAAPRSEARRRRLGLVCKILSNLKFQKFQFENLVDFEKCCKTHIYLQKSVPIQPKTSNILPKFAKNWQLVALCPPPPRAGPPRTVPALYIPSFYLGTSFLRGEDATSGLAGPKVRDTNINDISYSYSGSFSAVSTARFASKY